MTTRICRRCGTGFITAGPQRGRRLCDACRAARATFFDCPRCGQQRETTSASHDPGGRPVGCWDCRQADTAAAQTIAIVDHVARREAHLTRDAIAAAVTTAAPSRVQLKWLAEHLAADPDALGEPGSKAPRVLGRLAVALQQAGATTARRPRCVDCGRPRPLVTDTAAGRVCSPCAHRRRAEPCATCHTIAPVARRMPNGHAQCRRCWGNDPANHQACGRCGRRRRVNARSPEGDPVCAGCYTSPEDRCDSCGQAAPIVSRRDGRSLCPRCYPREGQPRRLCGACGRISRINRRARGNDPDLCNACNWAVIDHCTRCAKTAPGRGARRGQHLCLGCIATERLEAVLTGADGVIPAHFEALRVAFAAVEQPRSTLVWLDRSPGVATLRALVTGAMALTHAALDELTPSPSLNHLRHMLVATGALPERDEGLARLERHIAVAVGNVADPEAARLLRSYGTWRILGRLRRRPTPPPTATIHAARYRFNQAVAFLAWLDEHDLTLDTCNQHQLEHWITDGPVGRTHIRELLAFAARQGTASQLDAPPSETARRTPPRHRHPEQRWSDARRLLHDDQLDTADRVSGALVVLYAQPLTRIARLRRDDIVEIDGDVHLRLGDEHLHMPEPLGGLLRALPARRQIGPSGHVPAAERWLFPGQPANRHQHPEHLATRLRAIDIPPRIARTDALLQLARQVPAKVLADLLNLHVTTAVRWTKLAGGDWNTYAASRVRRSVTP